MQVALVRGRCRFACSRRPRMASVRPTQKDRPRGQDRTRQARSLSSPHLLEPSDQRAGADEEDRFRRGLPRRRVHRHHPCRRRGRRPLLQLHHGDPRRRSRRLRPPKAWRKRAFRPSQARHAGRRRSRTAPETILERRSPALDSGVSLCFGRNAGASGADPSIASDRKRTPLFGKFRCRNNEIDRSDRVLTDARRSSAPAGRRCGGRRRASVPNRR